MKRNDLTIADIACPKCKSKHWYQYGIDEQEFCDNGTGHCRFDIHCSDCGTDSRVSFEFEYRIANSRDLANPDEKGGEPKVTCLNCKHLMFSDMYGECNKQLRIVNPSDTCEYAEPKERGN